MIFALCILVIIGVVAFFHYLQGFLSATISAILVVIAAMFALAYHEAIVESLLGGKMANQAHAMALLGLFALVYLLLRVLFDKAVPGNVRLPFIMDKVGAAVMGVIAGIFAAGIVAIAAQELPFRTTVAGYTNYPVEDELKVTAPTLGFGRSLDTTTWNQLKTDEPGHLGPAGEPTSGVPIVSADSIVISMLERLSGPTGSLQNGKPFQSVHPDFLAELFGQRLGIEPNASHVALNIPSRSDAVRLLGVYLTDDKALEANEADTEIKSIRGSALKPAKPTSGQEFLVVRVLFGKNAADDDGVVRASPGAVRLVQVLPAEIPGEMPTYEDLFPVGTLENGRKLWLNRADDFLFLNAKEGDVAADFVFLVKKKAFGGDGHGPAQPGSFVEVKRMGRLDLSNEKPKLWAPPQNGVKVDVLRKPIVVNPNLDPNAPPPAPPEPSNPAPSPSPQTTTPEQSTQTKPAQAQKTFDFKSAEPSTAVPVKITVASGDEAKTIVPLPGGTIAMKEGKISTANVDSGRDEQNLSTQLKELYVPADQAMVQVHGAPVAGSAWTCAQEPEQIELADSEGKHYQPFGIYVAYKGQGADRFRLKYTAGSQIPGLAPPENSEPPTEVVMIYLVPKDASIVGFYDHGQKVKDLQVKGATK